MDTNAKIAVVDDYVRAFENADIAIIRSLFAADATVEDPVGTDLHEGLDAICTFYQAALDSGAKLALTGTPRCAGNAVAFPFQVRLPGMVMDVIDVFEFNQAGKIVRMRAYWGADNIQQ